MKAERLRLRINPGIAGPIDKAATRLGLTLLGNQRAFATPVSHLSFYETLDSQLVDYLFILL